MAYIAPILEQHLKDGQEAIIPVIITLKDDTELPAGLKGKGNFIFENKIFAASITGIQLKDLSTNDAIEAIEPEGAMGIL